MSAERDVLARLRDGFSELKSQLHKCPESLREHLQEQLARVSLLSYCPMEHLQHKKKDKCSAEIKGKKSLVNKVNEQEVLKSRKR